MAMNSQSISGQICIGIQMTISNSPSNSQSTAPITTYSYNNDERSFWMPIPEVTDSYPGLETLTQLDQLRIEEEFDNTIVVTGLELNIRYWVKNKIGQAVFFAKEETTFWKINTEGLIRKFVINSYNSMNDEIIRFTRIFECNCCGLCCFCEELNEVVVECPPGQYIGSVKQIASHFNMHYDILDANQETVLKLFGPSSLNCRYPEDYNLIIYTANGLTPIGKITQQLTNFVASFPIDLDVRIKAIIFGAVILLDFMLFERDRRIQCQRIMIDNFSNNKSNDFNTNNNFSLRNQNSNNKRRKSLDDGSNVSDDFSTNGYSDNNCNNNNNHNNINENFVCDASCGE